MREISSDAVYSGRNSETKGSDDYVRCARCGFPVKLDRHKSAPDGSKIGWGIEYTPYQVCATDYNSVINYEPGTDGYNDASTHYVGQEEYDGGTGTTYDGIDRTIYDPVVKSGCPQCGTLRYNK